MRDHVGRIVVDDGDSRQSPFSSGQVVGAVAAVHAHVVNSFNLKEHLEMKTKTSSVSRPVTECQNGKFDYRE